MVPNDRKYTREHDWVLIEDGIAKLGITDHAQDALGDIVYVELPAVGDELALGDCYTTIESVKAASPVYTPVAGEVVEINEELDATPNCSIRIPMNSSSLLSRSPMSTKPTSSPQRNTKLSSQRKNN